MFALDNLVVDPNPIFHVTKIYILFDCGTYRTRGVHIRMMRNFISGSMNLYISVSNLSFRSDPDPEKYR
jgi:hypothetical protein